MSGVKSFQPKRGMIADFNSEPIKGHETGKTRPCVIVSNNLYNAKLSVIQVVPITAWTVKKSQILTNIVLNTNKENGLSKKSIADCLQTRPVDYPSRYIRTRGSLGDRIMQQIDEALKIVFALD